MKKTTPGLYGRSSSITVAGRLDRLSELVTKYGAADFIYAANKHRVLVGFRFQGLTIRMTLPGLDGLSPRAIRQRAAAFQLAVTARLESVILGIESAEEAFLPYAVLETGETVAEFMQIDGVDRQPTPSAAPTPRPRLLRSAEPSTPVVKLALTAPAASSRAPVLLPVVPIAAITRPEDKFSCGPLKAKLTAARCVAFADDAVLPFDRRRHGRVKQHACEDCADGRAVKAALAAAATSPTVGEEITSS